MSANGNVAEVSAESEEESGEEDLVGAAAPVASLTASQQRLLTDLASDGSLRDDVTLLQGPPGTGKTTTLVHLLLAMVATRRRCRTLGRLLVCAPSNRGVQELLDRLLLALPPPRGAASRRHGGSSGASEGGDASRLDDGLTADDIVLIGDADKVPADAPCASVLVYWLVERWVGELRDVAAELSELGAPLRNGGAGLPFCSAEERARLVRVCHTEQCTRAAAAFDAKLTRHQNRLETVGGSIAARHPEHYTAAPWPGLGDSEGGSLQATFQAATSALAAVRTALMYGSSGHGSGDYTHGASPSPAAEAGCAGGNGRPLPNGLAAASSSSWPCTRDNAALADCLDVAREAAEACAGLVEARLSPSQGDESERYAECLGRATVVFCTLSAAGSHLVRNMPPVRYLIVDEAAQATEPECLVPLSCAPRGMLLAGDPHQLTCMCTSRLARVGGLERSLMQRLMEAGHARLVFLETQHRMHPAIASFPSRRFYGGRLRNAPVTESAARMAPWLQAEPWLGPCSFVHVAEGAEARDRSGSLHNAAEAAAVVDVVCRLRDAWSVRVDDSAALRVLTFYAAQVRLPPPFSTPPDPS